MRDWDLSPGYLSQQSLLEEQRRTRGFSALERRSEEVAAEMALRSLMERAPVDGRIPPPTSAQQLWAHHKYSVMARDPQLYREIGRRVSAMRPRSGFSALALELSTILRETPNDARLVNALEHMWGYVRDVATQDERDAAARDAAGLMRSIQTAAVRSAEPYLMASTALSELAIHQITKSPNHQIP